MDEEFERVLLVKPDVFVYNIPIRTTNRAHRAADWDLDRPDFVGRIRLVSKGDKCILNIEEKDTGQLYAKCPIDTFPSVAIQNVADSSRYFVIRVQDDNGRSAFIGMGFSDRGDSFDLNVALQDHFKSVEKQNELENFDSKDENQPKLDLRFKEGETIKVNLNIAKKGRTSRPKTKPSSTGGQIGVLPPPPGGLRIPPSSKSSKKVENASSEESLSKMKDLNLNSNEFNSFTSANSTAVSSAPNSGWTSF